MTNYKETKEEIQKKFAALKEEMRVLGESYFKEETARIFDEFPNLKNFSWTQYTPYFNDGDVCEFNVHSDYPNAETFDGQEYEDLGFNSNPWISVNGKYEKGPEVFPVTEEERLGAVIPDFLGAIDEDVMRSLFGDHVKVTVSREGIEVEEYEHE